MEQSPSCDAVTQLVKKFLVFSWNPKAYYRVHKSLTEALCNSITTKI